jgi:hypothetical protein
VARCRRSERKNVSRHGVSPHLGTHLIKLAKTDDHVAKFLREALGKDDKQLVGALGRFARSKLALAQGMHFSLRSVG